MWLQKWIWERYKELRLKTGLKDFTFEEAKEILSYDSEQTIYKLLNELERLKIIKAERTKKDRRLKRYKIVLDLKDIPYSYLTIPSNYKAKEEFLASTGSMAVQGTAVFPSTPPSRVFEKIYEKGNEQLVTIVPEKPAKTIEDYLIRLIQEYKSPEAILNIIKRRKIDFDKVIKELNSYQKRYFGALLEILEKKEHEEIIKKIYGLTKNDNREFSIFPREIKKIPKNYKKIAKKWRIYLNIDEVNLNEL